MVKAVILDGHTVKGEDLNFDAIRRLVDLTEYDNTSKEQVIGRVKGAEIVFTNKVIIDKEVMDACPELRFVAVFATGYNVVDVVYAKEKGITVSNVPAYSTDSVVQMTFALILELAVRVSVHAKAVADGEWKSCPYFCFWKTPLTELSGKTLGIIGYGSIGKAVEKVAKAFNMNVLVHNRTPFAGSVELEYLLENSDIVSLHCPLTAKNAKMINGDALAKMKKTAFLINTARGPLVDEQALYQALKNKDIAGAALDVIEKEPMAADNRLAELDNCVITPHIAWATKEARSRLIEISVLNLKGYLDGKPINTVTG